MNSQYSRFCWVAGGFEYSLGQKYRFCLSLQDSWPVVSTRQHLTYILCACKSNCHLPSSFLYNLCLPLSIAPRSSAYLDNHNLQHQSIDLRTIRTTIRATIRLPHACTWIWTRTTRVGCAVGIGFEPVGERDADHGDGKAGPRDRRAIK